MNARATERTAGGARGTPSACAAVLVFDPEAGGAALGDRDHPPSKVAKVAGID